MNGRNGPNAFHATALLYSNCFHGDGSDECLTKPHHGTIFKYVFVSIARKRIIKAFIEYNKKRVHDRDGDQQRNDEQSDHQLRQ